MKSQQKLDDNITSKDSNEELLNKIKIILKEVNHTDSRVVKIHLQDSDSMLQESDTSIIKNTADVMNENESPHSNKIQLTKDKHLTVTVKTKNKQRKRH